MNTMDLQVSGPEQIRAAFTTAIDTTSEHLAELASIARVLDQAADRYEALQMTASTLGHLRDGAAAVIAAAAALGTAEERLQAALGDFNDRDGRVADAVAETGNLMQADGYTTTFDPTGVQERPMTSPPAHPSAPPETTTTAGPTQPTERDLLARGAHIAVWSSPQRQRDRAREWDAGRVEAEQRAAAYEHADEIIAARAQIASGPGGNRMEAMREHGIVRCPSWCPQNADEHDHEEHIGPPTTFTTNDGDTVSVRPRVSWWPDTEPTVELAITPAEGGDGTLVLTAAELGRLQQLSNEVLGEAAQQHHNPARATGKPAYPGAFSEAAGADHDVNDPAAAATAIDLQSRAASYCLNEDTGDDNSNGPYMDWSWRTEDGVRHFEIGDGTDTTNISMTTDQLQQLHNDIGRVAGVLDDGAEDPGQLSLNDGAYVDWSVTRAEIRSIEFGDGVDAVQLELTDTQLLELHQRLGLQLHFDEQDSPR